MESQSTSRTGGVLTCAICACGILSVAFLAACLLGDQSKKEEVELLPHPLRRISDLRQHTEVNVEYSIVNHASVPALIRRVHTSCVCSSSRVDKKELLPGEMTRLVVTLDSGSSRGLIRLLGLVFYQLQGSPEIKNQKFAVTARVDPDILVSPEELAFTLGGSATSRTVTITPQYVKGVEITDVFTTRRFFKAVLLPSEGGNSLLVRVDFDPDSYNHDAGAADLVIVTDSDKTPRLSVALDVVQ